MLNFDIPGLPQSNERALRDSEYQYEGDYRDDGDDLSDDYEEMEDDE